MTRRKLGAVLLGVGLVAVSCGGSNNANSSNNPANNENSQNNPENNPPNNDESPWEWSATVTGLEGTEIPLPDKPFGGPGVAKVLSKLAGTDGSQEEGQQVISFTAREASAWESLGEKEVSLLISWGDPRYECVSNFDDMFEPVGATLTMTSLDPGSATFEADLDCYLLSDDDRVGVPASITGELEIIGL